MGARPPSIGSRPLRWPKFAVGLAATGATVAVAAPALRIARTVLSSAFVEAPSPSSLFPPTLGAAVALASLAWLVADAAFDRLAPPWLLTASLLNLLLLGWLGSSLRANAEPSAAAVVARNLFRAREAAEIGRIEALRAEVESLPAPPYRDRWFRTVAPSLTILDDRDGPVLVAPEGARPGALFLAIARSGQVAWLSATVLEGDRVVMLRDGGRARVLGVSLCHSASSEGATPC